MRAWLFVLVCVTACGTDDGHEQRGPDGGTAAGGAGSIVSSPDGGGAGGAGGSGTGGTPPGGSGGAGGAMGEDAGTPAEGPPVEVTPDALRTIAFYDSEICRLDDAGDIACFSPGFPKPRIEQEGPFISFGLNYDEDDGHGCGLHPDGSVICWKTRSRDPYGPLCGTGVAIPCSNDGVPPDAKYVDLSTGGLYSCGVTDAGKVHCWGLDNEYNVAVAPDGTDFVSVETGGAVSCALRKDGQVTCWGNVEFEELPLPEPAVQVEMVGSNRCLLLKSGAVQCDGPDFLPEAPADVKFARISSGRRGFEKGLCGLTREGAITCWGAPPIERITPPPGPYLESANTTEDVCGLRGDGVLECWGQAWGSGGDDETCALGEAKLSANGDDLVFDVGLKAWGIRGWRSNPTWTFATQLATGTYPDQNEFPFVFIAGWAHLQSSVGAPRQVFPADEEIELKQSLWGFDATAAGAGELLCSGLDSGSTFTRHDDELLFDVQLASLGTCPGDPVTGQLHWSSGLTGTLDGIDWGVTSYSGVGEAIAFGDGSYLKYVLDEGGSAFLWGLLVTSPEGPFGGQVFCIGAATGSGSMWTFKEFSTLGACPVPDGTLTGCIR